MAVTDYRPRMPVTTAPERELVDHAKEAVAQAQALRGDFLDREAKLRQAADIAEATHGRTDRVLHALDEKQRSAERAAEEAGRARRRAQEIFDELDTRYGDLLTVTRQAREVQGASDALTQQYQRFQQDVDAARVDLQAFLEDIRLGREELHSLKPAPSAPAAVPGDFPSPVSFPSVPTMYPAGPTVLGFLYPLITGTIQAAGGTMTGDLTVDLSASSGPTVSLTSAFLPISGLFGVILDKAKTLNTTAHGIGWKVGGAETWSLGQDFDTNNTDNGGTGDSDFIVCNDRTANAGAGADIMRFSHAAKDTVGSPGSCKMEYGGIAAGSPRTKTSLWNVTAGAGLGGINLNINSANAREHIALINAHATSKRATINYNDLWLIGPDIAGIGTDHGLTYRDKEHSLNRLYIESSAAISAKVGINTTGPVGGLHSATSQDPTLYDTVQTGLAVGFSTIANRTWLVQQILDAAQTENFLFMMGSLGAGSTRATPVTTSTSTPALGIKANQTQMDLIAAPSGTNQTIVRGVSVSQTGGAPTVGFLGATPVIRAASNEDLRTSLINSGLITGGTNPLSLNGGQLTAGIGAFSGGLQGSGSSFQWSRLLFSFSADSDEALTVTTKQNVLIQIQAGVISTTRNLDVVATNAGGFWIIINQNANPVVVKIGANSGITVGATRARILCAPGGGNMFALTGDINYAA